MGLADDWRLGRRASVSQGEIAYEVFGEGPPVVLVHGTPSWSYLWRNVVPALSSTFAVYVFDLLGYGDSPARDDAEVSIPVHARVLAELVERWGLDAPAAAGHDIGGATVLRAHLVEGIAFRAIALVDAVVLAPWVTPTTQHVQQHLDAYRTMPTHIFEQITATHLRTAVSRPMDADTLAAYQRPWAGAEGQAAYLQKVANFDEAHTTAFESLLATISVPVRIIWGDEDAWLDPSVGDRVRDMISGAELTLIHGAGHFAMEDAPAEVGEALLEFFGRPTRKAS